MEELEVLSAEALLVWLRSLEKTPIDGSVIRAWSGRAFVRFMTKNDSNLEEAMMDEFKFSKPHAYSIAGALQKLRAPQASPPHLMPPSSALSHPECTEALNELGIQAADYNRWPDYALLVVAQAWRALRGKMATFQQHANRPIHAEETEAALRARGWSRSHLPAHRRTIGEVDFALPVEENPLHPHMQQVHQASEQAIDAFAKRGAICVCFLGGSGVGKTTAAFDLLSKEWGFYLSAVEHQVALQPEYGAPAHFLQLVPKEAQEEEVIQATLRDLLSRMLVLYVLHVRGLVTTPLAWLLAQLDGAAALIGALEDLVTPFLGNVVEDSLAWLLRLLWERQLLNHPKKPLVVIDEAQIWCRYGQYAYGDPTGKPGNLLQVVAVCLAKRKWLQVLVGTQMRLADASAVLSYVAKNINPEVFVVPVSLFLSEKRVLDVLASPLKLDVANSEVQRVLAPLALQLVGRPRFVGRFITSFLKLVASFKVGPSDLASELAAHLHAFKLELCPKLISRFVQLRAFAGSLGHEGTASADEQVFDLILQSSLLRFEREGALPPGVVLPVQRYQMLDICGFQVEDPKAVPYSQWKESRVDMLRPAPLEPLMLAAALEFQTPQRFVSRLLQRLIAPEMDPASRGNLLDVAVGVQMSMLGMGSQVLRPWLCSLCQCNDVELPNWIAPDTKFTFCAAVEFNQSLWRYFASIPLPNGPPDDARRLLHGVPAFPYQVDEVLVRPETAAGADLVGVWPTNPQGALFITFSHAWYSRGVTEKKAGQEHKRKGDLLQQYSKVSDAQLEEAQSKKRKVTRAGPDTETVTEMSLPDRALLVRGLTKHLNAFQIIVSVELPCRQGEAPPLIECADRTLRVCVDHRNVKALFPSMPENMERLLEQQLQEMVSKTRK
jgi:hypothetical protein